MTPMPRTPCLHKSPAQRGFTLIEILVAVVIIAVSVLGLGGLLAKVHTNAYSALLRTDATIVMTDMAERLMANRANVITTPADYTTTGTVDCSTQPTTTVPARDLWQFRCMAKLWLPSGTGSVAFDSATTPTIATVSVTWDDSRGTNGSSSQTLSQTVNLK